MVRRSKPEWKNTENLLRLRTPLLGGGIRLLPLVSARECAVSAHGVQNYPCPWLSLFAALIVLLSRATFDAFNLKQLPPPGAFTAAAKLWTS